MSIGSWPTNTLPSGATQTAEGWINWGASAISSTFQSGGQVGRVSAEKPELLKNFNAINAITSSRIGLWLFREVAKAPQYGRAGKAFYCDNSSTTPMAFYRRDT